MLLWGAVALVCYPLLAGWGSDVAWPLRALLVSGVVACALLMKMLMGGMTVYRPIMEFGGWGIRGAGKKRAWTAES